MVPKKRHTVFYAYDKIVDTGIWNGCQDQIHSYKRVITCNLELKGIYEYMIISLDERLAQICDYYDKIGMDLKSFAQLVGINYITAQKNISLMGNNDIKRGWRYWLFRGIEDSREEKDFKYNRNGMPFNDLIHTAFLITIQDNNMLNKTLNDYLIYDMEFGKDMLIRKRDDDGNVTYEKFYPKPKLIK